jgi:hypothetical protein
MTERRLTWIDYLKKELLNIKELASLEYMTHLRKTQVQEYNTLMKNMDSNEYLKLLSNKRKKYWINGKNKVEFFRQKNVWLYIENKRYILEKKYKRYYYELNKAIMSKLRLLVKQFKNLEIAMKNSKNYEEAEKIMNMSNNVSENLNLEEKKYREKKEEIDNEYDKDVQEIIHHENYLINFKTYKAKKILRNVIKRKDFLGEWVSYKNSINEEMMLVYNNSSRYIQEIINGKEHVVIGGVLGNTIFPRLTDDRFNLLLNIIALSSFHHKFKRWKEFIFYLKETNLIPVRQNIKLYNMLIKHICYPLILEGDKAYDIMKDLYDLCFELSSVIPLDENNTWAEMYLIGFTCYLTREEYLRIGWSEPFVKLYRFFHKNNSRNEQRYFISILEKYLFMRMDPHIVVILFHFFVLDGKHAQANIIYDFITNNNINIEEQDLYYEYVPTQEEKDNPEEHQAKHMFFDGLRSTKFTSEPLDEFSYNNMLRTYKHTHMINKDFYAFPTDYDYMIMNNFILGYFGYLRSYPVEYVEDDEEMSDTDFSNLMDEGSDVDSGFGVNSKFGSSSSKSFDSDYMNKKYQLLAVCCSKGFNNALKMLLDNFNFEKKILYHNYKVVKSKKNKTGKNLLLEKIKI